MPHDPGFHDYVKSDRVTLYKAATGSQAVGHGLWGDGLKDVGAAVGDRVPVTLRGRTGWIKAEALGGQSLLEFYFIDVGQGDGLLIKTPDFRHIMLDGGYPRASQPTGKSAADFVDWKFFKDYDSRTIVLDAMIASHIDFDHYGGLNDILDVDQLHELDCTGITIDHFYHPGLCHWAAHGTDPKGFGPWKPHEGRNWFTRLLDDRASAEAALTGTGPRVRGYWGDLIGRVVSAKTAAGTPTPITRLSQDSGWLPGFPQTGQAAGEVAVRVLGPLQGQVDGAPALMRLAADPGQNSNGTSVLLRFDYGLSRVLLTGDLNANAQRQLLIHYAGREREFASDVAKACHHGSDDVSFPFLNFVKAACTVISSGDAESHDHPKPRIVAASGASGYATFKGDEMMTPLVYSTELARSVQIAKTTAVTATDQVPARRYEGDGLKPLSLDYAYAAPGALNPSRGSRPVSGCRIMQKLIYGLVNVRTDGKRILCATMNEGDGTFATKTFDSRF